MGRATLESELSTSLLSATADTLTFATARPGEFRAASAEALYRVEFTATEDVSLRLLGSLYWGSEGSSQAVTFVELHCVPSHPQPAEEPVKLTVTGDAGADVYIDQHWIGSPPVEEEIAPGNHRLTIKSLSEVRSLVIEAEPGDSIRYHID